MNPGFEDRTDRFFGYVGSVSFLTSRAQSTGLTAIIAGPQMGKSWTLNEVARRLASNQSDPFLVGYAEAVGNTPDLLLRAVSDLYQRWLVGAKAREQFVRMWDQQKDNLLPGFATAVGKIAGDLPGIGKLLGGLVDQALGGLVATNADLKSDGLALPPLQYDQARALVDAVATISGRKVALCLDAWEHSSDPEYAAQPLAAFVLKAETWPHCHVFLTSRPDPAALKPLEAIADSVSGEALIYHLPDFAPDPSETSRMAAFLNNEVQATQHTDESTLLRMIDGCPGVIGRWTSKGQRDVMQSQTDLARIASDAQAYRFIELETALEMLAGDVRLLALRLALLPKSAYRDGWDRLRKTVLDNNDGKILDEAVLDDLFTADVLEGTDPPTFGHAKRLDTAVTWFGAKRPTLLRQQTSVLARRLGTLIDRVDNDPATILFAASLRDLATASGNIGGDPWPGALCAAATTLFREPAPQAAFQVRDWILRPETDIAGARLVAVGLSNAMTSARQANDSAGAARLGETLRALAYRLSSDVMIEAQLAIGLNDIGLLAGLVRLYPENTFVRIALAQQLYGDLDVAREAGEKIAIAAALDQLRNLAATYPGDAAIAVRFCRGMYNVLRYADESGDVLRAAALLDEIDRQTEAFPTDADIAECLARGLYQLGTATEHPVSAAERADKVARIQDFAKKFPASVAINKIFAASLRHATAIQFGKFDLSASANMEREQDE